MKKNLIVLGLIFSSIIIVGVLFSEDKFDRVTTIHNVPDVSSEESSNSDTIEIPKEDSTPKSLSQINHPNPNESFEAQNLTNQQNNAIRNARQYIEISGFSREGLIDQLSSSYGNGYDISDATIAVDSLNINWNEQAVRSAKQYLEISGFSCSGLIEQLSSSAGNKYTNEQATYGARQDGACS